MKQANIRTCLGPFGNSLGFTYTTSTLRSLIIGHARLFLFEQFSTLHAVFHVINEKKSTLTVVFHVKNEKSAYPAHLFKPAHVLEQCTVLKGGDKSSIWKMSF